MLVQLKFLDTCLSICLHPAHVHYCQDNGHPCIHPFLPLAQLSSSDTSKIKISRTRFAHAPLNSQTVPLCHTHVHVHSLLLISKTRQWLASWFPPGELTGISFLIQKLGFLFPDNRILTWGNEDHIDNDAIYRRRFSTCPGNQNQTHVRQHTIPIDMIRLNTFFFHATQSNLYFQSQQNLCMAYPILFPSGASN